MLLHICNFADGTIKTALKLASYNIVVDYLNPTTSTFDISPNTFDEDYEMIQKGDLAVIWKTDLAGTPLENYGFAGIVESITETDAKTTVVVKEIQALLEFPFVYDSISEVSANDYLADLLLRKYKSNIDDNLENIGWISITEKVGETFGSVLPAFDKYSIQSFKDVANSLYLSYGVVVYPEVSWLSSANRFTITYRIYGVTDLGEVLLEGNHISGISLTESISSSPNKLILNPANGNYIGTRTMVYYLHTSGEVNQDKTYGRITPVNTIYETYSDDDYFEGGEAKLLELAKAKLLPSLEDKEFTFTLKKNVVFPLEELSPRCKVTFHRKGKEYKASLTKFSFSDFDKISVTFGYKRTRMTDKIKLMADFGGELQRDLSSIRRNRPDE